MISFQARKKMKSLMVQGKLALISDYCLANLFVPVHGHS